MMLFLLKSKGVELSAEEIESICIKEIIKLATGDFLLLLGYQISTKNTHKNTILSKFLTDYKSQKHIFFCKTTYLCGKVVPS